MKDIALIVAFLIVAYVILSWASAPAEVAIANTRADTLQAQVNAQATEIVQLRPTPIPCRFYPGYPYC